MQGSNRFAERTQLVTDRPRCLTRSHYVLARWLDVVDGGRPSGRVLASVRKWIDHAAKKPLFRSPNLCSVSRVAAKGRFSRRRRDFLLFDPKRAQHTHTIPSFLRGRYNINNIVFLLATLRYTKASNGSMHKKKVANHFFQCCFRTTPTSTGHRKIKVPCLACTLHKRSSIDSPGNIATSSPGERHRFESKLAPEKESTPDSVTNPI